MREHTTAAEALPHNETDLPDSGPADRNAGPQDPTGPPGSAEPDRAAALFGDADSDRFRTRWHDVQAGFVDDPQRAVRDADQLVEELVRTLTTTFAQRKQALDGQWQQGGEAETEDLRLALRGYRTFFDQLLPH